MDIVGYSKLLINEQAELLQELNRIVRNTSQFRSAEASAAAHPVRIGKGGANPLSMFGDQIRMTLGYMRFALSAKLDLTTEIRAKESRHTDWQDTQSAKPPRARRQN